MSRPFTLPIVIACSAHALLMFGFTKPPRQPVEKRPDDICVLKDFSFDMTPVVEDEKPVETASLDKPVGGKIAPPNPSSDEPPVTTFSAGDFLINVPRDNLRINVKTNIVSPGVYTPEGDSEATEYGPGVKNGKPIYSSTVLDNEPRARVQTPPNYPISLKSGGVVGEVWVEFVVDERGRVVNPRVLRSTHADFNAPTLAAVAKWRFEPGMRNMAPVRFRMVVPVKFNLND